MPTITVSRQRGSMGSYIALEVAQRLDLAYLDRQIIESVAREAGVSTATVEAIEEHAGRLARVLHLLGARPKLPALASASLREREGLEAQVERLMVRSGLGREEAYALAGRSVPFAYVPRQDYLALMTSVIREYAAEGSVMLVGRGGQMILRDEPGVLHVQVHASFETRVYNIIQREGVKWREAAHRVRRADEQRAGYMRRLYNVDWLATELYDLVISTDRISSETAVDMIILAAQAADAALREGGGGSAPA